MPSWYPTSLTVKGVKAGLQQAIERVTPWWENHVTKLDSTAQVEPYAWLGSLPTPLRMEGGHVDQPIRDFTYNVENQEWGLSFVIDRKHFEDDQTGQINMRIAETGSRWANWFPYLFTQMLVNGATTGNNAYDGATFFHDTRTEGDSGTIDNKTTSAVATDFVPTTAEFLLAMSAIIPQLANFKDDVGQPRNIAALNSLAVIIPPASVAAATNAMNSTLVGGGDSNAFGQGLAEVQMNPFLTATDKMYVHAVGDSRKGIAFQKRTELETVVYASPEWVDSNNGLRVTLRQRYVFAYLDFSKMIEHTWS